MFSLRHLRFATLAVFLIHSSTHAQVPVPADIVSWWAGEDTPLDIAGGKDGLAAGGPQFSGGKVGRAFLFDGLNDFYQASEDDAHDITGDLTIESWINLSITGAGNRTIVSKTSLDGLNACYRFFVNSGGKLAFSYLKANADVEVNTVAVLPLGEDVHVAVTLLAGDLRFYINGVESAHIFLGTDRPATDGPALIGAAQINTAITRFFAGEIDELSLYKRALTGTEIAGIHGAGVLGKARFDAARDFERWAAGDAVQSGAWRYGEVQRETSGQPPIANFGEFAAGADDSGLNAWSGAPFLGVAGNTSGNLITRAGAGGTNIYYPPGALNLHPGANGQYAALRWTAPAAGDYAVSVLFAGADGKPTTTDVLVLDETAFGNFTLLSRTQINGCLFENEGTTRSAFQKVALDAGEKVYFLVGYGANADASFDNTSVFANIVPLRLLSSGNAPVVVTGTPGNLTASSATLNGSVNPKGQTTTYRFQYGTTIAYGQSSAEGPAGNGNAALSVNKGLTGLTPNTLYHYRLVATNAGGTTNGNDATFTTSGSGGGTPFTVRLEGQASGVVVRPETGVEITAVIEPANAGGATIAGVEFVVNDEPDGQPDTEAPYEFSTIVERPGPRTIYAIATDTLGRTATSASVTFTVSDAAAGVLALQTIVVPANGEVAPGGKINYFLVATNTSPTAKLSGVKLTTPIPDGATVESANFVNSDNQPVKIKGPKKNPVIAQNGSSVDFYFGEFAPLQTIRARLELRVAYDVHEGSDPIENVKWAIGGKLGKQSFSGRFAVKPVEIKGPVPANAPRLALSKGIVDLEGNELDNTDFAATADGSMALTSNGDLVTFLLVATNAGTAPAAEVTVTDRLPAGFALDKKSVKVNGNSPGSLFKTKGQTMTFEFGDFAAGQTLVITYQAKVTEVKKGGPAIDAIVLTSPAGMRSESLSRSVDSSPERLSIRILPPVTAVVTKTTSVPSPASLDGVQTYFITFSNPSRREARDVRIRQPLQTETAYVDAFLEQTPNVKFPKDADHAVTFNVGTLAPGATGVAVVKVMPDRDAILAMSEPSLELPNAAPLAPASLARTRARGSAGSEREAAVAGLQGVTGLNLFPDFRGVDEVARLAIGKVAPMSVEVGAEYASTYTIVNMTNQNTGLMFFSLEIPANASFVRTDSGIDGTANIGELDEDGRFVASVPALGPYQTATMRVFLRATGSVRSTIVEDAALVTAFYPVLDVYADASVTTIIQGDASAPDNQEAIARGQLSLRDNDGSTAMSNSGFLGRVGEINSNSRYYLVTGTEGLQLSNGGFVIKTAGSMVAAGGGNLISNDGSTIENKGGASLVGNDGASIVLHGPPDEIIFNLIGNDGSTLVGLDGGTLLDQIVRGQAGNAVARGAVSLIALNQGNFVRDLVGNDGSTVTTALVGNDGASFFPLDPLATTVLAAGGDVLAVGEGAFLPDSESIVSNGDAYMVAAGGGNMVAAGGGNLISNDGSTLRSAVNSGADMLGRGGNWMSNSSAFTPGLGRGGSAARAARLQVLGDHARARQKAK